MEEEISVTIEETGSFEEISIVIEEEPTINVEIEKVEKVGSFEQLELPDLLLIYNISKV